MEAEDVVATADTVVDLERVHQRAFCLQLWGKEANFPMDSFRELLNTQLSHHTQPASKSGRGSKRAAPYHQHWDMPRLLDEFFKLAVLPEQGKHHEAWNTYRERLTSKAKRESRAHLESLPDPHIVQQAEAMEEANDTDPQVAEEQRVVVEEVLAEMDPENTQISSNATPLSQQPATATMQELVARSVTNDEDKVAIVVDADPDPYTSSSAGRTAAVSTRKRTFESRSSKPSLFAMVFAMDEEAPLPVATTSSSFAARPSGKGNSLDRQLAMKSLFEDD